MEMKLQAALTAMRDELRKIFEPFGARVDQFEIQFGARCIRWRSRTPDYPSHHVGGAFEEWTRERAVRRHGVNIILISDESILDREREPEHLELMAGRWMPPRFYQPNIYKILDSFGIALENPIITVIAGTGVWNHRKKKGGA